ncbi:MAG: hypothetical protein M3680_19755 [Myxococcota bacterium]|nr:hypothetical protein [Myxococcota bacterium]
MHYRTVTLLALTVACSSKRDRQVEPPTAAVPAKTDAAVAVPSGAAWWLALPDLPPGTFDLSIRVITFDGPVEQQWSWVAGAICAEDDTFMSPSSLRAAHAREGLRCGRALVEHEPAGARRYAVDLNRPAHPHPLPLFVVATTYPDLASVESLLVGFHREEVGDVTVLCRTFDPSTKTCAERLDPYDKALAVVGGHVVGGSYVALGELLRWSHRERTIGLTATLPGGDLDLLPPGATWTIGPRRLLPYSRDEALAFAEIVRTHARAVGIDIAWGVGTGSITLVPRCSTPACPERTTLATALRLYQQAWAAEAPARMRELMAESPGPDADCARPLETAMIEQVTRAEVTMTDLVELRLSLPAGRLAELDRARPPSCRAADDARIAEGVARVRAAM